MEATSEIPNCHIVPSHNRLPVHRGGGAVSKSQRGIERNSALRGDCTREAAERFRTSLETLRRLRNGGVQTVRREHVQINAGAQAVVGAASILGIRPPLG